MRAWPFGWSLFATATYIKGHWHCTGGASLREPVAVPLDKVPQPPGEFHAQALHVVRAVDVRRSFLQTSTISFLRLLPAPPRERLLQPVAHPREMPNTKLPDVAKSAGLFNAHASKHLSQLYNRARLLCGLRSLAFTGVASAARTVPMIVFMFIVVIVVVIAILVLFLVVVVTGEGYEEVSQAGSVDAITSRCESPRIGKPHKCRKHK